MKLRPRLLPVKCEVGQISKRISRQRQAPAQAAHIASDDFGNGTQFFEGRIALPPLHAADVAGIYIRFQREILLGQPFGLTRFSNSFTEHLQRSCFFQRLNARRDANFPSSDYIHSFRLPSGVIGVEPIQSLSVNRQKTFRVRQAHGKIQKSN